MNDGTSGGVCFVLFCFVLLLGAGIIQLQVIVRQLTITTRVNRCLQCRCAYDCAFMKLGVCFRIDSDVTSGQSTDLVPSISLKEAYTLLKSQEGRTPKFCQNPLLSILDWCSGSSTKHCWKSLATGGEVASKEVVGFRWSDASVGEESGIARVACAGLSERAGRGICPPMVASMVTPNVTPRSASRI